MERPFRTYYSFLSIFCMLILLSCGTRKNAISETVSIAREPKIIFLNYSIKKSVNGNITVNLIDKITSEGKIKDIQKKEDGDRGDLFCNQMDKNDAVLQSSIIKNPLVKHLEYLDDSKTFKMKQVELDSTYFSLRLQLHPNAEYISITEPSNSKPLIKTKLN